MAIVWLSGLVGGLAIVTGHTNNIIIYIIYVLENFPVGSADFVLFGLQLIAAIMEPPH